MSASETAPPTYLMRSKLAPPVPRQRVERPALVERIRAAGPPKLTLIRAPAGWGKTTLLSELYDAERDRCAFAWLTLEAHDDDPSRFWLYAIEALGAFEPRIGAASRQLLAAPGVDVLESGLPALVAELELLEDDTRLVLDDFHAVKSPELAAGVAFLLDHLPPSLRLLIASRTEPRLPLPRLRARGEVLEIGAADLSFSPDEAAELLNDLLELGLERRDVVRLRERTEGWPAGLSLAALSLRNQGHAAAFIDEFTGGDRHVVDFFASEVLSGQPPEVQELLLRTSVLGRFGAPLCEAVGVAGDAAAMLDELERSNIFLIPLDSRRQWYRYHHLFADLLRLELKRRAPELGSEVHRRAAAWHLGEGLVREGIDHTLAAGDVDAAVELLAVHWHPFVLAGENRTVLGWLEALPEGAILGDARMCVARAWTLFSLGRFGEMSRFLDAAEEAPLPAPFRDGNASLAAAAANARASQLSMMGDNGRAHAHAARAADLEPEDSPWRAVALVVLANTAFWLGDLEDASAHLRETLRLGGDAVPTVSVYALGQLALAAYESGEAVRARASAAEALAMAEQHGLVEYWMPAIAHVVAGEVAADEGRTDEAEEELRRGLELAQRGSAPPAVGYALLALARLRARGGEREAAAELAAAARRTIEACPDPGSHIVQLLDETERRLQSASRRHVVAGEELSERELAVLRLLATNLTQREIGRELYVSLNTVKSHAKSVFRKLGTRSRAEAVERARALGLLR